jgi:hypothetical protein
MGSHWRKIALGAAFGVVAIVAVATGVSLMSSRDRRPALVAVRPLAPVTRSSTIIVPVAISQTAIRDALERTAPRELSGKPELPSLPLLSDADIGWSVTRGPFTVSVRPEGLSISTALTGSMHASGPFGGPSGLLGRSGDLQGLLGNLLGGSPGSAPRGRQEGRTQEQRADVRGTATVIAHPSLLPDWRVEPNLTSQVTMSDESLSVMGMKLSVPDSIRPLLDRAIDEQVALLGAAVKNSPVVEAAARNEWAKMCRSVSLGALDPQMPNLWLELRPTRAFAANPRIVEQAVYLTVGVQADTRIVPNETKPECPFPAQLEIVQQMEQGRLNIGLPIDIPFTEINRLMEAQLKGKIFPEDKSSAFSATINGVSIAASGDKLLISVAVRANETKSWFGFGADATIHVWGRPVLDRARQMLRLADVSLDVESQAAFGMLGAAARAALPYLEQTLSDKAVIDLVPLAQEARKNIAKAVADFSKRNDAIRVDAQALDLRLVGLEFDAKTLRVIGEAAGTVRAAVLKLDEKLN